MKYEFSANTEPEIGMKYEESKIVKDPIKITINIEIEKRKFESLNKKYTEGLSKRILKLFT